LEALPVIFAVSDTNVLPVDNQSAQCLGNN
jgi:hypothetical protein